MVISYKKMSAVSKPGIPVFAPVIRPITMIPSTRLEKVETKQKERIC